MTDFTKKWPEYDQNKMYHSISEKLPVEEDIVRATADARVLLGPPGQMLESSPFVEHNAVVSLTNENGSDSPVEIWYGDIDLLEDVHALKSLSRAVGRGIVVFKEADKFSKKWNLVTNALFFAENGAVNKSRFTNVD